MRHLTVRNLPERLAEALRRERERRGTSLNQTVIELLAQSLGTSQAPRSNGLAGLAGTWTAEEHEAFERAIAETESVDEEMWR